MAADRSATTPHEPTNQQQQQRDFAAWRARLSKRLAALAPEQAPVVLVACGSFNPPTRAHLRLFAAGARAVDQGGGGGGGRSMTVVGGLLSPVGDGYGKAGLAPASHRLVMCALAAAAANVERQHEQQQQQQQQEEGQAAAAAAAAATVEEARPSGGVDVCAHAWEATREDGRAFTRTLDVLRHIQGEINGWFCAGHGGGGNEEEGGGGAAAAAAAAQGQGRQREPAARRVRVMLLGGTDLVESMRRPGAWSEPDALLREHGVVCVDRPAAGGGGGGRGGNGGGGNGAGEQQQQQQQQPSAVDEELLRSRVLHAECDDDVMLGVSSSRAREALRAAAGRVGGLAAGAGDGGAAGARAAIAADPSVAELLDARVAEYAVRHGLYFDCG